MLNTIYCYIKDKCDECYSLKECFFTLLCLSLADSEPQLRLLNLIFFFSLPSEALIDYLMFLSCNESEARLRKVEYSPEDSTEKASFVAISFELTGKIKEFCYLCYA